MVTQKKKTTGAFSHAKQALFVEAANFISENETDLEAWVNFKSSELREQLTKRLHAKFIQAMIHGIDVGATMFGELDNED